MFQIVEMPPAGTLTRGIASLFVADAPADLDRLAGGRLWIADYQRGGVIQFQRVKR